jgi:deoxyribodipyrimidine photo-lyase
MVTVHIFRRDLRLEDNTALNKAAERGDDVLPVFIFDPRQVEANDYKSGNAVQFMIESLHDLDKKLRSQHDSELHVLWGEAPSVVEDLVRHDEVNAVSFNADITPFSKERDDAIKAVCEDYDVDCHMTHDAYLTRPGTVKTNKGTTYKVFSYFEKKAKKQSVDRPTTEDLSFTRLDVKTISLEEAKDKSLDEENPDLAVHGGRDHGEAHLAKAASLDDYETTREKPSIEGTSKLSAYLKFGVVSPREAYWAVRDEHGESHGIISELYWRDFYAHLLDAYPEVLHENMKDKYDSVKWRDDADGLERWKEGRTGFPIVDAAMRQLTKTGWMHNRCRMIVASFLCKDLRIHWKEGEQFFAQHLVDYDPASNNGGWQWAASTGADSQPYFRIFNPWRQQEDYDPDCEYIKEYVTELRGLDPDVIHGLEDNDVPNGVDYPEQILDHREASQKTKEVFKNASQ